MEYSDSNRWKRDTIFCLMTIMIMFVFVGIVFGLVFGYYLDNTEYLLPRAVAFMFLVSMVTIVACYTIVPKGCRPNKDWIELKGKEMEPLYSGIDVLCDRLKIPTPRVYVILDPYPNAFAYGRTPDKAFIVLTKGLIDTLDNDEIFAVIGHELSHIAHRDTLVKGIANNCTKALTTSSILIGLISLMFLGSVNQSTGKRSGSDAGPAVLLLLAFALIMLLFAAILVVTIPGACLVTRFAVSRNREYLADEGSARITGNPLALANALRKLENGCVNGHASMGAADAMRWTVDPNCARKRGFMNRITSTHPSTESRIQRLEKLAKEFDDEECLMIG